MQSLVLYLVPCAFIAIGIALAYVFAGRDFQTIGANLEIGFMTY